jgi:hypothetical protein
LTLLAPLVARKAHPVPPKVRRVGGVTPRVLRAAATGPGLAKST